MSDNTLPYTKEEYLAMITSEMENPSLSREELDQRIKDQFQEFASMTYPEYLVICSALTMYTDATQRLLYGEK